MTALAVLTIAGCGEQKKAPGQVKPRRPTLEEALKEKFNIEPGWNAEKKRFITIAEMHYGQEGKIYSMSLLHNGQIKHPEFKYEIPLSILALGKFAFFLQQNVSKENVITITSSSAMLGDLRVKAEERYSDLTGFVYRCVHVYHQKPEVYFFEETEERINYFHRLPAQDINLFKSHLAIHGLKFTLIGWSQEDGRIRMAFSIRHLENFKEMMKTATAANMEYAKKELRVQVKKGMKKLSKKLEEWSEDQPE